MGVGSVRPQHQYERRAAPENDRQRAPEDGSPGRPTAEFGEGSESHDDRPLEADHDRFRAVAA